MNPVGLTQKFVGDESGEDSCTFDEKAVGIGGQ